MRWRNFRNRAVLAFSASSAFQLFITVDARMNKTDRVLHSPGWTAERKSHARETTRDLWNHGFDAYMHNAFPMDELNPISCHGQGPNWFDPTQIHLNDVLANVSVTLVDNLDTLVTLGNYSGFVTGVQNVIKHVSFDVDTKPQVFETTIRVMGGLLSAHTFASSPKYGFQIDWYDGELLDLAWDLGKRLLPAFQTPTGIPYARVNLRRGVLRGETVETCSAGAGSLLLEFATLSRLTGDPRFEIVAVKSFFAIWNRRSSIGLIGNTINIITGAWMAPEVSGIGAGIDSFYEYALKMYVLTGETPYLDVWNDAYRQIMTHSRGRDGFWYRGVSAHTGEIASQYIDSLAAFWPGLQVLAGDVESAIKSHLIYWNLWRRFSGIPETFNILTRQPASLGYPLRPEFIESTYFLYRATRDSFYLDVGERVLQDLIRRAKVDCGLATISNLVTGTWEDRMESFALSETLKYLYLLFDEENAMNKDDSNFVFTTEGHFLILPSETLIPPSRIRREIRGDEQLQCPAYLAPRYAFDDELSTGGLIGTIHSRADFDYARLLTGLGVESSLEYVEAAPVVPTVDEEWWSPEGWCEVPQVEEYTLDWVLSSHGGTVAEDLSPGPQKVKRIHNGFIFGNITGVRMQITSRIDRNGYDITQLGPHRVFTGQKVYITDPAVTGVEQKDLSKKLPTSKKPRTPTPDVKLRFFVQKQEPPTLHVHNQIPIPFEIIDDVNMNPFDLVAATATFGGNPALPPPAQHPMRFSAHTSYDGPIRVVSALYTNPTGCDDHAPDIIQNSTGLLDENTVLFVRRGECTFMRKLVAAKQVGAVGVIVWNDQTDGDGYINPSIDPEDEDYAKRELGDVGIVIVTRMGGHRLNDMLEATMEIDNVGSDIVVEVMEVEHGVQGIKEEPKHEDDRVLDHRILYIGGHALMNTVLVL